MNQQAINRGNRWQPGQSGNPAGRPVGARQRHSERAYLNMEESWKTHGETVLATLAVQEPGTYAKLAYGILPRDVFLSVQHNGPGGIEPAQWALLRSILDVIEQSIPPGASVVPNDVLTVVEDAVRSYLATPVSSAECA